MEITRDVGAVARTLRAGGIAAFPTETVYGLGAVVWDADAVAAVFAAKRRPRFDPLIVHVPTPAGLGALWDPEASPGPVVDAVRRLSARWPGPLTLVVPRAARVPDLPTAGLPTVGVRVPDHPVARALLAAVGEPVVAPSANRFGRISPTTAEAVAAELPEVPWVLDGGPCAVGVESTVVGFDDDGTPVILRPGGVPPEELAGLAGRPTRSAAAGEALRAPGQLAGHYAPHQPVTLLPGPLEAAIPRGPWSVLAATTPEAEVRRLVPGARAVRVLSEAGDDRQAARGLFAALRALDAAGAPILVEPWPDEAGLGAAIRDRLRRAAAGAGPGT